VALDKIAIFWLLARHFDGYFTLEVCTVLGQREYRGNRGETMVMGTTFTVIPWERGHVSRGYRGDGEQCRR